MKKELGVVEVAVKLAVEIGLVRGIVARSQLIVCFMKEIRIFAVCLAVKILTKKDFSSPLTEVWDF